MAIQQCLLIALGVQCILFHFRVFSCTKTSITFEVSSYGLLSLCSFSIHNIARSLRRSSLIVLVLYVYSICFINLSFENDRTQGRKQKIISEGVFSLPSCHLIRFHFPLPFPSRRSAPTSYAARWFE